MTFAFFVVFLDVFLDVFSEVREQERTLAPRLCARACAAEKAARADDAAVGCAANAVLLVDRQVQGVDARRRRAEARVVKVLLEDQPRQPERAGLVRNLFAVVCRGALRPRALVLIHLRVRARVFAAAPCGRGGHNGLYGHDTRGARDKRDTRDTRDTAGMASRGRLPVVPGACAFVWFSFCVRVVCVCVCAFVCVRVCVCVCVRTLRQNIENV